MLKSALNNLWNTVAIVEGCSRSGNISTYLTSDRVVVSGPYGYGETYLGEGSLPIENWINVPAVETKKALDAMPDDPVIALGEGKITFRSGKFRASVPLIGDKGPEEADTNSEAGMDVSEAWPVFLSISDFASSPGATSMPELTNVYWGPEGIWACNRISMVNFPGYVCDPFITIPRAALMGVSKMGSVPISVTNRPDSLLWAFEQSLVITPKILGEYPVKGLQSVFERETPYTWNCNYQELAAAADRAAALSDSVELEFKANRLILRTVQGVESQGIISGTWEGSELGFPLRMMTAELKRFLSFYKGELVSWRMSETAIYQEDENSRCASALSKAE